MSLILNDLRVLQTPDGARLIQGENEITVTNHELRWLLVGAIPAVLAGRHPHRPESD